MSSVDPITKRIVVSRLDEVGAVRSALGLACMMSGVAASLRDWEVVVAETGERMLIYTPESEVQRQSSEDVAKTVAECLLLAGVALT